MPRIRRPSPALVVASAALTVALGGVTYAAIPAPDGSVHACHDARGTLRVIDSEAACDKSETALNFAQTGPQGAAGAPGAQGPPGQTRLLNFTRTAPVALPRKAGAPVGSFDLPEGRWAITFTGGVKIPGAKPVAFPTDQKVRAAALNSYRAVGLGAPVTCKMTVGDGSVRSTAGYSSLIGLLLPAVQKQHGSGGGGGTGKAQDSAAIYMQLVQNVPAGGARGVLGCVQAKGSAAAPPTPAAQVHDISINAVQVNDIGALNFTPGR
jgi:hypothetical protein